MSDINAMIVPTISGATSQSKTGQAPPSAQVDPMLTRSQVARILGVSPTTVTRWAREGRLACQVTLGGHHRFSRALIEAIRADMSRGKGAPKEVIS